MNSKKTDLYVGLFMVIGLLAFGYIAVNLGGLTLFKEKEYQLAARFVSVSGLKKGAAVEIAGVEIGRVDRVELTGGKANVLMKIHAGVRIERDSIAAIRTKGLIGEKYIKIIPGGDDSVLDAGEEIDETESALDIEEMIGKFIYNK